MAERFEIGKSGSVHVDAAELHVDSWSASEESDWQETTHSGSAGYYTDIPGTMKLTGSFDASFNLANKPVPSLAAGASVELILDYEDSNPAVDAFTAGVDSFEVTSEAKGVIKFTCNWHSIGAYAWAA